MIEQARRTSVQTVVTQNSVKHGTNITEVYITRIFVKTWSCSLSGAFWTFSLTFTWL